jgi:hypothetical protein
VAVTGRTGWVERGPSGLPAFSAITSDGAADHLFHSEPGHVPGSSIWRNTMTNWYARCAYNPGVKQRFHAAARARLRRLARILGFEPATFDLRSNPGGIAVSGEITLHHDHLYLQVSQPASRTDSGILIRTEADICAACRAVADCTDLAEEKGAAVHRAALAAIRAARQRQAR